MSKKINTIVWVAFLIALIVVSTCLMIAEKKNSSFAEQLAGSLVSADLTRTLILKKGQLIGNEEAIEELDDLMANLGLFIVEAKITYDHTLIPLQWSLDTLQKSPKLTQQQKNKIKHYIDTHSE